jgi:membrane-bound inhibitor of C-type lysozyme
MKVFKMKLAALGLASSLALSATDLTIRLSNSPEITRKTVLYTCDAAGKEIGVPSVPFSVEYINGGGNSLVVVPISGNSLIFSNVTSASGARYTAQQYTWWDARGGATLYSDSLAGKTQSACHQVAPK